MATHQDFIDESASGLKRVELEIPDTPYALTMVEATRGSRLVLKAPGNVQHDYRPVGDVVRRTSVDPVFLPNSLISPECPRIP